MANRFSRASRAPVSTPAHIATPAFAAPAPTAPGPNNNAVAPLAVAPPVVAAPAANRPPIIKEESQEPEVYNHPPAQQPGEAIMIGSDDEDNVAPAPAGPVAPPRRVIDLDVDDDDNDNDEIPVVVPSPNVHQRRAVLFTSPGAIRSSVSAWKEGTEMYWNLAKVIRFWAKERRDSDLGRFPMSRAHWENFDVMLQGYKPFWANSRNIEDIEEVSGELQSGPAQLSAHCDRVRIYLRTYCTGRPRTLDQLFLPHTPNEVRNVWRQYTGFGANLQQVGNDMLIAEHFDGFFPVLFAHN